RQIGRGRPDALLADRLGHVDDRGDAEAKSPSLLLRNGFALPYGVANRRQAGGIVGHGELDRLAKQIAEPGAFPIKVEDTADLLVDLWRASHLRQRAMEDNR